jgi:hypothetical protein
MTLSLTRFQPSFFSFPAFYHSPRKKSSISQKVGIFEGGPECFRAGEKHDKIIYGLKNRGS